MGAKVDSGAWLDVQAPSFRDGQANKDDRAKATAASPYSAAKGLAILTAFILPVAMIPYLLSRRQVSLLRKQVADTQTRLKVMQKELRLVSSESATRREDQTRMRGLIHDLMQELDEVRTHGEEIARSQAASDRKIQSDLQRHLDEIRRARAQTVLLPSLGTSLADVAGFMHEIELEMGLSVKEQDKRGVERLRQLAQKLQALTSQEEKGQPIDTIPSAVGHGPRKLPTTRDPVL